LEQAENEAELVASFTANLPEVEAIGSDRVLANEVLSPLKIEFDLQELSYYRADYRSGMPALYYGGPEIDRQNVTSQRALDIRDDLILEAIELGEPVSGIIIVPQSSQIIAVAPVFVDEELNGIVVAVLFINNSYVEEIGTILDVDSAIITDNSVIASSIDESANLELLLQTRLDLDSGMQSINITYDDGIRRRLHTHILTVDGTNQGYVAVVRSLDNVIAVQQRIQTVVYIFLGIIVLVMLAY